MGARIILICLTMIVIGCGVDPNDKFAAKLNHIPKWVISMATMERPDGYQPAGIFDMNDTFYAQFCDSHGNQRWMKYDNETNNWSGVKYVTLGCRNAEYSEGPGEG